MATFSNRDKAYLRKHHVNIVDFDEFSDKEPGDGASKVKKSEEVVAPRVRQLMRDFDTDFLSQTLVDKLEEQKVFDPNPIQTVCIPEALAGYDLIGISKTGSGKTLSFVLPILMRLEYGEEIATGFEKVDQKIICKPKACILTPTRELAIQIFKCIETYSTLPAICLYGGTDRKKQIQRYQHTRPVVVVATPGRFKDLLDSNVFSVDKVEISVLDEADRMLDKNFLEDVQYLLNLMPKARQTMFYSATWNFDLDALVKDQLRTENLLVACVGELEMTVNDNIKQFLEVIPDFLKKQFLKDTLERNAGHRILVFCNRRSVVQEIFEYVVSEQISPRCGMLSSDLTQDERENVINHFRAGRIEVVIATDVASRGLDVDDVQIVLNYEMPMNLSVYVHRIGRTGRNGKYGQAISLLPPGFSAREKVFRTFVRFWLNSNVNLPARYCDLKRDIFAEPGETDSEPNCSGAYFY